MWQYSGRVGSVLNLFFVLSDVSGLLNRQRLLKIDFSLVLTDMSGSLNKQRLLKTDFSLVLTDMSGSLNKQRLLKTDFSLVLNDVTGSLNKQRLLKIDFFLIQPLGTTGDGTCPLCAEFLLKEFGSLVGWFLNVLVNY